MTVKSIFASKTFWFNAVAFVVMAGEAIADVVPPEYAPVIASAIAVGNILLRFNTSTAVSLLPPKR